MVLILFFVDEDSWKCSSGISRERVGIEGEGRSQSKKHLLGFLYFVEDMQ